MYFLQKTFFMFTELSCDYVKLSCGLPFYQQIFFLSTVNINTFYWSWNEAITVDPHFFLSLALLCTTQEWQVFSMVYCVHFFFFLPHWFYIIPQLHLCNAMFDFSKQTTQKENNHLQILKQAIYTKVPSSK